MKLNLTKVSWVNTNFVETLRYFQGDGRSKVNISNKRYVVSGKVNFKYQLLCDLNNKT